MAVLSLRINELIKGKDDKGKGDKRKSDKRLVAESFNWDGKSVSSEDEGTTKFKAFMAIAYDEPSVGKGDARSGQWVEITMKKVHRLLSITDNEEQKHVLDYTHVDVQYVEDQRNNLVNKFNALKQDLALYKSKLCNLKNTMSINYSLQNEVIRVNLENISLKDKISDLKKDDVSTSEPAPMITSDSEDDSDNQVKKLRSDNGTKFKNHNLEAFCDEKGILQNLSSPCTLKQNGVAERRNRTLIEAARTMLNSTSLPTQFWREAVNAVYHLGKFNEKADDGFFLGYSSVAKAFRVFNIRRQEMEETFHLTFSEDDEAISQTSTEGIRPIGTKWVLKNKKYERGIVVRNKARLVVQGHTQEERINYIEVFAPIARIEAIRLFLAYASFMGFTVYQMDVKSAFLYGTIDEEVYVMQPPGFQDLAFPAKVYKVEKAMYQANPKKSYLVCVKRIFRYLKGTPNLGLWYLRGSGFDLKEYSDSDYAGCNLDIKSTSGGCQILRGKLVCWSAKKQTFVAMSSTKAEYVVAAGCCAQVLWIKSQLADYDVLYDKVPIFCDNASAISISNNPVLHSRTKHIDIKYHFIRDHILKGDIELHFVPTNLQLADSFTKPLALLDW
nr:retrovirus-related Pol polyprotein from transposon TNT 1-94 [Tanacetum cinerariifolium]